MNNIFTCLDKSKPIKQELNRAVILPPMVSVLQFKHSQCKDQGRVLLGENKNKPDWVFHKRTFLEKKAKISYLIASFDLGSRDWVAV